MFLSKEIVTEIKNTSAEQIAISCKDSLLKDNDIDVVTLQEKYDGSVKHLKCRRKITGFDLIGDTYERAYICAIKHITKLSI